MRHVFISYCHEDADFAHALEAEVKRGDFRTWRDLSLNAGDDWRAEIDAGIREALAVVVIFSPAATESAYVNYEWAFALGSGIPVIPVLHKPVETDRHPRLNGIKYLDFTSRASRPWNLLLESLNEIQDASRPSTIHVPRGTPPSVQRAAQALDSMDAGERRSALSSLAQTTHPLVVEILAQAVRHPLRQVRFDSGVLLAERKDPRAVPALLESLRTPQEYPAVQLWMLSDIGEAAVPLLVEALDDERSAGYACAALGAIGGPDALHALLQRLRDPKSKMRGEIFSALGGISGTEAVNALSEGLRDPDSKIRARAALALNRAADPAAIPALLAAAHDPEKSVRDAAISALVSCTEKGGQYDPILPTLVEELKNKESAIVDTVIRGLEKSADALVVPHLVHTMLTDEREQARSFARTALRTFGTASAPALRAAAVSSNAAVRARAIDFLGRIKDEVDIPLLIDSMRDENRDVRMAAIGALESERAGLAVPALIERLQDDDGKVVRYAVVTLGRIKAASAVPALIECLEEDNDIADAAANALDDIGTKEARAAAKAWNKRKAN